MSKKRIEKPEADELLKHGKEGSFDQADEWYDPVQPHRDGDDMDASWRLKGSDYTQRIAEGTHSEGLARVALNERMEDLKMRSASRKISGIVDSLTEEEMWEVLRYGDTVDTLTNGEGGVFRREDAEKKLLEQLKQKYEPELTEEAKKELKERRMLAELKKKYED